MGTMTSTKASEEMPLVSASWVWCHAALGTGLHLSLLS